MNTLKNRLPLILIVLSILLLSWVTPAYAQDDPAEGEGELLAVYAAYMDAFANDVEMFPDILIENATRHHLFGPDMENGELVEQFSRDEIAEFAMGFQTNMPGAGLNIDYAIERGDMIWTAFSITNLPDGATIMGILVARFEDGKIAEVWVADDELAMLSLLEHTMMMMEMEEE